MRDEKRRCGRAAGGIARWVSRMGSAGLMVADAEISVPMPCNVRMERSGGTDVGGGVGRWRRAQSDELGRHSMQRGTVRSGGAEAGNGGGGWPRARSDELGRHPMQRGTVRSAGAGAGGGVVVGEGGLFRRTRTTPHATGHGAVGRSGMLGGVCRRAAGAMCRRRTKGHATWRGGVGWRRRDVPSSASQELRDPPAQVRGQALFCEGRTR